VFFWFVDGLDSLVDTIIVLAESSLFRFKPVGIRYVKKAVTTDNKQ
jgi:hypothetical protein